MEGQLVPERFTDYKIAAAPYKNLADKEATDEQLMGLLDGLRAIQETTTDSSCVLAHAAVCLELAERADSPSAAEHILDEAEDRLHEIFSGEVPSRAGGRDYFYAGMYLAYMPKYRTLFIQGQRPSLDDEAWVWSRLSDPELTKGMTHDADIEASIQLVGHLLNARFNLRSGRISRDTWPPMPRQYNPGGSLSTPGSRRWVINASRRGPNDQDVLRVNLFYDDKKVRRRGRAFNGITNIIADRDLRIDDVPGCLKGLRREAELLNKEQTDGLTDIERHELDDLSVLHDQYGQYLATQWLHEEVRRWDPAISTDRRDRVIHASGRAVLDERSA